MSNIVRLRRRLAGQAAGAPSSLYSAEPAYNMQDGFLRIGYGDDGGGVATGIKTFAKDDFIVNIPAGGTTGQALTKSSNADGAVAWATITSGGTYSVTGQGIKLVGTVFNLDFTEIAASLTLTNYAALAGATFTGKVVTAASATGGAGFNIPHGAAPTTPVDGDQWTTTAGMFARINGATKQQAFLDSNITGSAATLTTSRNFSISGGGITASAVSFNGSAAVVLNASVDAGHITLARMANLAANSFIGNNTGSAATPIAMSVAQAKTLLAYSFSDISGTVSNAQLASGIDATKLTGTIDAARLPASVFQAPIVAASNIASLTAPQQAEINAGSTVVTSDGRAWMYVSGTKTLEASYREMGDTTPDWSVIANKPSFHAVATSGAYNDLTGRPSLATVATSGAYADLSGKPSLGSMASQNSGAVAITGGTISGIDLDGGSF